LIDSPLSCGFQVVRDLPRCADGTEQPGYFTASQIASAGRIYSHSHVCRQGKRFFPGWPVGAEVLGPTGQSGPQLDIAISNVRPFSPKHEFPGVLVSVLWLTPFFAYLESMELHFSSDVESRLQQVALANGRDAEQLVKDTVARMLENQNRFSAGVQRGIEQADRGEFVEHKDVVNRNRQAVSIVRLIRWTTEAADEFEAAVKHLQQDNPHRWPECRSGGYRPH
jgi:predicted transcriptional regulator